MGCRVAVLCLVTYFMHPRLAGYWTWGQSHYYIMMLTQDFQPMAMQLSNENCNAIGWKACAVLYHLSIDYYLWIINFNIKEWHTLVRHYGSIYSNAETLIYVFLNKTYPLLKYGHKWKKHIVLISIASCKTVVTPLLMYWSYQNL